ncbi:hypothetical protein NMY22_g7309 [Coprinellus aureogranulatus]|nr:hypothetical protein NMY22_g7309 [Coprinellus aureogranulatus]
MSPLNNFPTELLLSVISRLDPEDVQSLQSSSRSMRSRLDDKVIWIEVFRAVCRACAIFPPSYPVDEMHTLRLRRAALAPARFGRLLESNSFHTNVVPPIEPITITSIDIGDPVKSEKHFLVPGGRFLVTAHPYAINIWDLGVPDRPALTQPILVAHVDIEEEAESRETSAQLAVGMLTEETLRVVVTAGLYHTTTGYVNRALAYDVKLKGSGANFKPAGKLIFDRASFEWARDCVLLVLSGDLVLIHLGNTIGCDETVVWDVGAGWYAFAPKADFYPSQRIIVNSDTVIQHDGRSSMAVWSCSPAHLATHPVDSATPIKRSFPPDVAHLVTKHIPQFPLPKDRKDVSRPFPQVVFASSNWHCTDDKGGAIFDIILEDCSFGDQDYQRSRTPIRGYRYKFVSSLKGGAYQVETPRFELQASFNLPPNTNGVLGLETHLPRISRPSEGCGTRGNFDGSSLVVDNVRKSEYLSGLLLYSVPPGPGTSAGVEIERIPARVACVLAKSQTYSRQGSQVYCIHVGLSSCLGLPNQLPMTAAPLMYWNCQDRHRLVLVRSSTYVRGSAVIVVLKEHFRHALAGNIHLRQWAHISTAALGLLATPSRRLEGGLGQTHINAYTSTLQLPWMGLVQCLCFSHHYRTLGDYTLLIGRTVSGSPPFSRPDEIMGHIVELPPELLLSIGSILGPGDILRLQASCRTLRARLNSKAVWIQALRNVCKANTIFYPSYPVEEMSVARLQRASMAPARFARLLESHSCNDWLRPSIEPAGSREVHIGDPVFSEIHVLVPGGRYLVIAFPSTLRLFDLGSPDSAAHNHPILVASETIDDKSEGPSHNTAMTVRILGENRLRVIVALRTQTMSALAYDIVFAAGSATISRVATLRIDRSAFEWAEPHILLTSSTEVSLIQLIEGAFGLTIVWNVPGGWYAFGPNTRWFAPDRVILEHSTVVDLYCGAHCISVWSCSDKNLRVYPVNVEESIELPFDLDEFYESDSIPAFPLKSLAPGLTHLRLRGEGASRIWQHGSAALFDAFFQDETTALGFRLRVLPSLEGEAHQISPPTIEVRESFRLPPNLSRAHSFEAHHPIKANNCGGLEGEGWFTGLGIAVHGGEENQRPHRMLLYSTRSAGGVVDHVSASVVSILEHWALPYTRQICMSTGRMLRVDAEELDEPSWDDIRSTAYVLDFLRPSSGLRL